MSENLSRVSEPDYCQTISPFGKPLLDIFEIEYKDNCHATIEDLEYGLDWSFNLLSAFSYLWRLNLKPGTEVKTELSKVRQFLLWELEDKNISLSIDFERRIETVVFAIERIVTTPFNGDWLLIIEYSIEYAKGRIDCAQWANQLAGVAKAMSSAVFQFPNSVSVDNLTTPKKSISPPETHKIDNPWEHAETNLSPSPQPKSPRQLISDPYFRVEIDLNGSSPHPDRSIWSAQHACVAEGFALDDRIPSDPATAIINNQLKPKHWSVLKFGYVVLHFGGFPHDTVMQLVRHQDSEPLVCSLRYTGKRFIAAAKNYSLIESLFYTQAEGEYATRSGKYYYSMADRDAYFRECHRSTVKYAQIISSGKPEELARRSLLSGYRQNFVLAGTLQAVFHWLDQRTLADSQIEAQTLAWMALDKLEAWEPGLFGWYRQNRAGKNLLAP